MEVLYMMGLQNESIEEAEMLTIEKKKGVWKFAGWKKALNPTLLINNQVLFIYRSIWSSLFLNYFFH